MPGLDYSPGFVARRCGLLKKVDRRQGVATEASAGVLGTPFSWCPRLSDRAQRCRFNGLRLSSRRRVNNPGQAPHTKSLGIDGCDGFSVAPTISPLTVSKRAPPRARRQRFLPNFLAL